MVNLGRPRPTCEECGLIELEEEAKYIWDIFYNYQPTLFVFSGMGGWNFNTIGYEYLCRKLKIREQDEFFIYEILQMIGIIYFSDTKEADSKLPDEGLEEEIE